ncbi:MAG: STAS domain-containing protein [Spirochaetales bacterium]|uniref:Anti-sigma factor antagonist n=1 Tax=Candidatus Thalassospirochaeta sargassi TaxID=3119039 RepID=A0AAJ1IDZ9_9SPIO|nr:STAS domain-containing protein [Spirochaetales bacterium]
MEIKLKKYHDIYIMVLEGELDLYNAPELEKVFQTLVNQGIRVFILDFEKVSYIDSSGVGILLKLNGIANGRDFDFILSAVDGEVLNVLKLTNLIQFFPMEPDYTNAVKKLLKESPPKSGVSIND